MENLLPNEDTITTSEDTSIILTSRRIIQDQKKSGNAHYKSIMLEHVTSCENITKSEPLLLVLVAIALIGSFVLYKQDEPRPTFILVGIAIVFLVIYLVTRKNVVLIASPTSKIVFEVQNMKREKTIEFINKVEAAINNLNKH